MNTSETSASPQNDALAVTAVRAGDRDRFQELVERHADRVYAIAWCRLGDRDLAEEAAHEAFISAYRRLALLGHAEKFGAWIAAIARNVAINLGIRRRSELRRRERWAVEQSESEALPADGSETDGTTPKTHETLRESLAALPSIHRESLVLYYLEGRSTAEAAQSLNISENTFKVRLHRARAVLRKALETRLESGLDQFRAPPRLTHAVMLALPAQPSSLLAAGGLLPGLAKSLPFSTVLVVLQLVSAIPGLLLAYWIGRKDMANFKDSNGFRRRLYARFLRGMLLFVAAWTTVMVVSSQTVGPANFSKIFGALLLLSVLDGLRRLYLVRNPMTIAAGIGVPLLAVPMLGLGLFHWPVQVLFLAQGLFFLLMSWAVPRLQPRMDYSLFTRATFDLFPAASVASPDPTRRHLSADDTNAFARFLGQQYVIDDWRRSREGLQLRLARVVVSPFISAIPFYWGATSRLTLSPDGRIRAKLGEADRIQLTRSSPHPLPPALDLEARVEAAVRTSREAFLAHRTGDAVRAIGEQPSESIFRSAPASSSATRWRVWILRLAAVIMSIAGVFSLLTAKSPLDLKTIGYAPVSISAQDIREFLGTLRSGGAGEPNTPSVMWNSVLYSGDCVPDRTLFPPEILADLKSKVIRIPSPDAPLALKPEDRIAFALENPAFLAMALGGYFSDDEQKAAGLDPASIRSAFPKLPLQRRNALLSVHESSVQNQPCTVLQVRELAQRIRFLELSRCLDLVDLTLWVPTLVQSQILSDTPIPGRCELARPSSVRGLFQTGLGDYLRDTRDALYLLKAANALDQIDREACVQGILRLHLGRGAFASDDPKAFLIQPSAVNTWLAFESLHLLDAEHRVPDLAEWQFRTHAGDFYQPPNEAKTLQSASIIAWCLRERFRLARTGSNHFGVVQTRRPNSVAACPSTPLLSLPAQGFLAPPFRPFPQASLARSEVPFRG